MKRLQKQYIFLTNVRPLKSLSVSRQNRGKGLLEKAAGLTKPLREVAVKETCGSALSGDGGQAHAIPVGGRRGSGSIVFGLYAPLQCLSAAPTTLGQGRLAGSASTPIVCTVTRPQPEAPSSHSLPRSLFSPNNKSSATI